ncbi:uncharacterized protein L969DRAFT_201814 [Mixia osmundae IAM 14324]|uniref:Uncharacterized protein n=1 Tax=Mixia osmundae (strain CBS 9802 / IAM 14324 / JCM 22182 / KY 12970) TaxID=764103 RepID=G7DUU6_MIXOS|nr:uncharacterized protein L969DRAFT_201814 [Mixia osmundae IAM 14324]KEI37426.1 hypothetical protein L969DRAFT_201814 [Mixia osmundae IAM 14324]GAA94356.1 hypothetical protein E5Q_01007 [Mixia osmundae IAM 14324]
MPTLGQIALKAVRPNQELAVSYALLAAVLRRRRYTRSEVIALFLLSLNWPNLPFVWHVRMFIRVPLFRLRVWLYANGWLSPPKRSLSLGLHGREHALAAIGRSPWALRNSFSRYAGWAGIDWNNHLSNSSYATSLDNARMRHLIMVWGSCLRFDGVAFALAGTEFEYIREVPMLESYEVETHILTWEDKFAYLLHRWLIKPSGKDPNEIKGTRTGKRATVAAIGLSKICFSVSTVPHPNAPDQSKRRVRQTAHPGRVFALSGYGTSVSNWSLAKDLRKAKQSRQWLAGHPNTIAPTDIGDGQLAFEQKRARLAEILSRLAGGDRSVWRELLKASDEDEALCAI